MKAPYKECTDCIAKSWCKRYTGEVPKPSSPAWCNPKFRLDKAISLTNLPKRYIKANQYNYKKTEHNVNVFSLLKPYIENIVDTVENGKQFLFWGAVPGTGKTFHGALILNQYIYKQCLTSNFDFENPLGYFINYADLMDMLRYNKDDETDKLIDVIKNVPLLLLDDVGSGTATDFTKEQTYIILNYRYNKGLSTIYTTNLKSKDLFDAIGRRSYSRMTSNCETIEFTGSDMRRKE